MAAVDKVRVGIVGCGRIVRGVHLPLLIHNPRCEVVAIMDPDPQSLDAVGMPEVARFEELDAFLANEAVEAVVVAAPPVAHESAAIETLRSGRHVYVEKPLTHTGAACTHLVDVAAAHDHLTAVVGHNYRFEPGYQELLDRVQRREMGETLWLTATYSSARRELPDWKQRRARGGGALLDLASHHLDLLTLLVGRRPAAVWAQIRTHVTEDDLATVQLDFGEGVMAWLLAGFGSANCDRLQVGAEAGTWVLDRLRSPRLEVQRADSRGRNVRRLAASARRFWDDALVLARLSRSRELGSYRRCFDAFLRAVRGEVDPMLPSLVEGAKVIELVEAAEASARTGRVVVLDG